MAKKPKIVATKVPAKYVNKAEYKRIVIGPYIPTKVPEGTTVIFTKNPKAEQLSTTFLHKWLANLEEIPTDHWPVGRPDHKHTDACDEGKGNIWGSKCPAKDKLQSKPIADMHTMQIVNAIKWTVRMARRTIGNISGFGYMNVTVAELLAPAAQWKSLLDEARKRELLITGGYGTEQPWVQECLVAIAYYNLEK